MEGEEVTAYWMDALCGHKSAARRITASEMLDMMSRGSEVTCIPLVYPTVDPIQAIDIDGSPYTIRMRELTEVWG